MIAKIIPIKSVRKSNFSALVQYLTNPQDKSERISQITVTNCYTEDLLAGVIEIQNTQEMNTRARSDKTCHLVLSFPQGERLSLESLNAIEARFCNALGFQDHQRVSVIHNDTDYQHVHIAISKIHPRTLTIHNPYYDYKIVARVCEQIEQEYGLTIVNHATVKDEASRVAQDIEARTGVESLLGWIKCEVLSQIKQADDWQTLHVILKDHGLELKERGNGFIIISNNGTAIKASSVDRFLSKGNLTQRLGTFTPDESTSIQRNDRVLRQFQPRPLQTCINTSKLYARYQEEQKNLSQQRSAQWTRLRHTRDQLIELAKREAALKRGIIKNIQAGRLAKKALFATAHLQFKTRIQVIQSEYREAYQNSKAHHARMGWLDWLIYEAKNGNIVALAVLRSRRTSQFKGNQVSAKLNPDGSTASHHFNDGFIKDSSVESITKIGTVTYQAGSTTIRDDGKRLIVLPEASAGALRDILIVAVKKYGNHLAITGTEQFRLNMAKAAVQNHMHLTFDDPNLEQYRQQLMKQGKVSTIPPEHHKRSVSSIRRSL